MSALAAPGHPDAIDHAPTPVRRHTIAGPHEDTHTVTLDLSATSLLNALAAALTETGMLAELTVLGANPTSLRASLALADLRSRPEIRAALTITLDPAYASALAEQLTAAAEREQCLHTDHRGDLTCDRLAVDQDGHCPDHTPIPSPWAARVAS